MPQAAETGESLSPLRGLVLAGGQSRRMHRDKAQLLSAGRTLLERQVRLLQEVIGERNVWISLAEGSPAKRLAGSLAPVLEDVPGASGPIAGILAGFACDTHCAWLVVAADMPFLERATLKRLLSARRPQLAIVYYGSCEADITRIEPLCAIYEPKARPLFLRAVERERFSPRRVIEQALQSDPVQCRVIAPRNPRELASVNSSADIRDLGMNERKTVSLNYFALLREKRGLSEEVVETDAVTLGELYEELRKRHGFTLKRDELKVAVNEDFAEMDAPLSDGDLVVFIPPVAGG